MRVVISAWIVVASFLAYCLILFLVAAQFLFGRGVGAQELGTTGVRGGRGRIGRRGAQVDPG